MHVMHCWGGKPLAEKYDCVCVCVCVCVCMRVSVCLCALIEGSHAPCDESYTGWIARRLAGWLEAVRQETHQLCTAELKTPVRFIQDSDFLVN